MEGSQILLLNSGGKDSRVASALLSRQGAILSSLFIELREGGVSGAHEAALRTHALYCVGEFYSLEVVGLKARRTERNRDGLPFSTMLTHSLAATFAVLQGFQYIASGYEPRPELDDYARLFQRLLRFSIVTPEPVVLLLPLANGDVNREGIDVDDCVTWASYA